MPAKGFHKPEPLDCRIKVQLTNGQQQKLAKLADEARVSQSEYMRSLLDSVEGSVPVAKPPPPKRPPPFAQQQLMEIHELAMQVRKVTAQKSKRVQTPVYHYVISWRHDENPTDDFMREVADVTCRDLGLEEHQLLFVAHSPRRECKTGQLIGRCIVACI
jgi:hypothetical protein